MIPGRCSSLLLALAATALSCAPALAQKSPLQPYQMVRSLQLVQDRLAGGDQAALPMQRKLLEMVDERLRAADPEELKDPKNFRALLIYAMSGGNPATIERLGQNAWSDDAGKTLVVGVVNYLRGDLPAAEKALSTADPLTEAPELGAFVALVRGSMLGKDRPEDALRLLDQARLLAPGTLVEEAALRRAVALAATQGDAMRFLRASTQYAYNYLRSPYASQFADAFVSGVLTLHTAINPEILSQVTALMDAEQEKVIYLRIARRAAIEGMPELSAFASARAEQGRNGLLNDDDPRAVLYSGLSQVTKENADALKSKLDKIDRSQLTEGDRRLLDAISTVATEIVAPPPRGPVSQPLETSVMPDVATLPPPAIDDPALLPDDADMIPDAAGALPATTEAPRAIDPASTDPTDRMLLESRRRLEDIDAMLNGSPR